MRCVGVSNGLKKRRKGKLALGVATIALAFGLPSAGLAVSFISGDAEVSGNVGMSSFTPSDADPRLAQIVAERSSGKSRVMQFTPAGSIPGAQRAVTVAVRIDDRRAQAIQVRSAIDAAKDQVGAADGTVRIAPTRYNLGLARGYRNFAQAPAAPALSRSLSEAKIPDLAEFEPTPGVRNEPSRFGARIALDEPVSTRGSRDSGDGDRAIDAAASYRLTRNLDVTAGVRYEQDRNRVTALPDLDETDSQAVYVGTQFRF